MSSNNRYKPNTALTPLNTKKKNSLYYGNFGLIWGVRKPHGLATTLGKGESLLDILIQHYQEHHLIQSALKEFGLNEELGMLTRLDNDTAGMVRFAHTQEAKLLRLQDQSKGNINKIYQADVIGRIKEDIIINTPIMHHRFDDTKMIAIKQPSDIKKGR
jgi:23S rRNA-/tRNA-specific pseudouridylate synthase